MLCTQYHKEKCFFGNKFISVEQSATHTTIAANCVARLENPLFLHNGDRTIKHVKTTDSLTGSNTDCKTITKMQKSIIQITILMSRMVKKITDCFTDVVELHFSLSFTLPECLKCTYGGANLDSALGTVFFAVDIR